MTTIFNVNCFDFRSRLIKQRLKSFCEGIVRTTGLKESIYKNNASIDNFNFKWQLKKKQSCCLIYIKLQKILMLNKNMIFAAANLDFWLRKCRFKRFFNEIYQWKWIKFLLIQKWRKRIWPSNDKRCKESRLE